MRKMISTARRTKTNSITHKCIVKRGNIDIESNSIDYVAIRETWTSDVEDRLLFARQIIFRKSRLFEASGLV